jgi:L-asparaginase II
LEFLTVRTGLAESFHDVSVLATGTNGRELYRSGEPDRPLFYRSAVKPLQATAALEAGLELSPEHLAVACASHSGWPAHLAIVRAILSDVGLDETALQCPAVWPLSQDARDLQHRRGIRTARPIFHNCSGKHAAMLGACVVRGWPLDSYLDPAHPLQQRIVDIVEVATGIRPEPVGVDGCAAPTLRGSVRGLAQAFATMGSNARFAEAASAISRFPSLVADNARADGMLARWWGGPVKVGAEGQVGMGRHGIGIAAKAKAGGSDVAVAAVIAAARDLGLVSDAMLAGLASEAAPPVLGGGIPVGSLTRS